MEKGKKVDGVIDADSAKSARSQLKGMGLFPSEIKEQKSNKGVTSGSGLNIEVDFQRCSKVSQHKNSLIHESTRNSFSYQC